MLPAASAAATAAAAAASATDTPPRSVGREDFVASIRTLRQPWALAAVAARLAGGSKQRIDSISNG